MARSTLSNADYEALRDVYGAEQPLVKRHPKYRPPTADAVDPGGATTPERAREWPSVRDAELVRTVVVIVCATTAFLLLVFAAILLLSHFMDFWFALVATGMTLAIVAAVAAHQPGSRDGQTDTRTTRSLEDIATGTQSHPQRWGMHLWH